MKVRFTRYAGKYITRIPYFGDLFNKPKLKPHQWFNGIDICERVCINVEGMIGEVYEGFLSEPTTGTVFLPNGERIDFGIPKSIAKKCYVKLD